MCNVTYSFNIFAYKIMLARPQLTDIQHHIEFERSVVHGFFGFHNFDFGEIAPMWKTNYSTDQHIRIFERFLRQPDITWLHTDGRHMITSSKFATFQYIRFSQLRTQQ